MTALIHHRHRLRDQLGPRHRRRLPPTGACSARACSTIRAATRACCWTRSDPHLARQNPADYIEGLRVVGPRRADGGGRGSPASRAIASSASASTRPARRRCRSMRRRVRWRSIRGGRTTSPRTPGSGRTTRRPRRRRRSPRPRARMRRSYLAPIGGTYSSEWWWSKIWRCLQGRARRVRRGRELGRARRLRAGACWPAWTTPRQIVRCVCAAGHKAMYSEAWGGLPPKAFLARLDPKLADLRDRLLRRRRYPPGRPAGQLSRRVGADARPARRGSRSRWAASTRTTAPSAPASAPARSSRSSARPRATAPSRRPPRPIADIPGICGIVNGSIMPGYFGIEAGQSAVGDLLNWWVEGFCEGDDGAARAAVGGGGATGARRVGARRARLEQRQPHGPRRRAADRAAPRPDAAHDARRDLPRADRGDGVRRARDRRAHARIRRADRPRRLLRRHRGEERSVHADLRRRDRPADADRGLAADAGARRRGLGRRDRRRGRRRLRRLDRGAGSHDDPQGEAFRAATRRRTPSTMSSTRSTASSTTPLAAWPEARPNLGSLMKRLLAIRERASAARA